MTPPKMVSYRTFARPWRIMISAALLLAAVGLLLSVVLYVRADQAQRDRADLAAKIAQIAKQKAVHVQAQANRNTTQIAAGKRNTGRIVRYLQGKQGLPGVPGVDGKIGAPGPPGGIGPRGFMGLAGQDGTPGVNGKNGSDGAPGLGPTDDQVAAAVAAYCDQHNQCAGSTGATGPPGADGAQGPPGPQGPAGSSPSTLECTPDPNVPGSFTCVPTS
jgi:hypothetical protein